MLRITRHRLVDLATAYADQSEDETTGNEFVIPEDLTTLDDQALASLHEEAVGHFDALYGDGSDLTEEDVTTLSVLTEGIETLNAERTARAEAAAERAERAAELASRARPTLAAETDSEDGEGDGADEDETDADGEGEGEGGGGDENAAETDAAAVETVTAAANSPQRRGVRVNLNRINSRHLPRDQRPTGTPSTIQDVLRASGDGTGYAAGQGVDWSGVGAIVDRRLSQFNQSQYRAAALAGRHMRQQFSVATIDRPIPENLRINSNDPLHVEEVLQHAVSESRLPGGSLVASGGWCAPSETVYDLLELETRDGLYDLPEVGLTRGGISRTLGPDFSSIYSNITGFSYTEEDDEAGDYDGEGGGTKPCYHVDCPSFEEFRLGLEGLCITAGLLQQRGYPEVIARTVRGALVAHDHRLSGKRLAAVENGSTAVTMPPAQQGVVAPLLTAIELEVEKMRTKTRISRAATLEAVFPFWVRGAIRADLSRRNGYTNPLDVSDAQISAWFTLRGIRPQFVYNWQDLNPAAGTVAYPGTVKFLLYPAGTWINGVSDIITIDTLYDSLLLGTNDYTALFTEEGTVVVKMGHESRVVTVPVCPDGSTGAQVPFDCDGSTLVPDEGDGDGDGGENGGGGGDI